MRRLTLERIYRPDGTYGFMQVGDQEIYTIEPVWKFNQVSVSCIPEGFYICQKDYYDAGGYDCIGVRGVTDRSEILFHKANWPHELRGCIAPNMNLKFTNGKGRGINSADAFNLLMNWFKGEPFELHIRRA